MVQIDVNRFLTINSFRDLAEYLDISPKELGFFAFSGTNFYTEYTVLKANGQQRVISAPAPRLKMIQRILADTFTQIYEVPDGVHGFVPNRSIATNAVEHVKKRAIIKIDLKDFFPTIAAGRIRGLLAKHPFPFKGKVLDALTNLVCHAGKLPQGAPTSPVLSNMICYRMDRALLQFARQKKLKYTRYADDIVLSSTMRSAIRDVATYSESGELRINDHLRKIIESNGFVINEEKTGLFGRGSRQLVTGIVVNEKCNFRRSDYRYLRNLFYYWGKTDVETAAKRYVEYANGRHYRSRFFTDRGEFIDNKFIAHIQGLLAYYTMIVKQNRRRSKPLQTLWTTFSDLTGLSVPEMTPERSILRTDLCYQYRCPGEAHPREYGTRGTGFVLKDHGIVTAYHCFRDPSGKALQSSCIKDSFFLYINSHLGEEQFGHDSFTGDRILDWAICPIPESFSKIPGLTFDEEYAVQEGEKVIAYGYADGKNQLRKVGAIVADILNNNEVIVDRAFIAGMSGGPVLNSRGDVIGLVTQGSEEGSYDKDGRFLLLKAIPDLTCQSESLSKA